MNQETTCQHTSIDQNVIIDDMTLEETMNILSAMADTARLKILFLLHNGGELCVSQITEYLNEKTNTVSMRLKKLYDAGLISRRREAKHVFYQLRDEHVFTIINNAVEHAQHLKLGESHD